jgi:hypothetical protein
MLPHFVVPMLAEPLDKVAAGLDAQRKLWKQQVSTAYTSFKNSNSHFKPVYSYNYGATKGTKEAPKPRPGSEVWESLKSRAYLTNVVPPLSGYKARQILVDLLAGAAFSPPFTDSCLVRTELADVPDVPFVEFCRDNSARLAPPHKFPELLEEVSSVSTSNPFPIVIDANQLTSAEGFDKIINTVFDALKGFLKKRWKDVMECIAQVPDGAVFVIRNVIDNKNSANVSATGLPNPFSALSTGNVAAAGAGVVGGAVTAEGSAAEATEFDPPVLTFAMSARGRIPAFMLSADAALTTLSAQEAMGGEMGYQAYGAPVPVSTSTAAAGSGDEWSTTKKSMEGFLARKKRQVTFRDLAQGMRLAYGELVHLLDELVEPTSDL